MDEFQKDINELHKRDPLAEAEKITGISYKDSDTVTLLGMSIMQDIQEKKKAAAHINFDSHFSMTLEEYIKVIERIGFKKIYEREFEGTYSKDTLFVYWFKEKSILLKFDSHGGDRINGGNFYYNIKPNDIGNFTARSSGGLRDGIWAGSHDCREAIKHHIEMLSEQGTFLTQWVESPFLWLLHYMDSKVKGYDYKAINKQIIDQFPQEVKDAITPDNK